MECDSWQLVRLPLQFAPPPRVCTLITRLRIIACDYLPYDDYYLLCMFTSDHAVPAIFSPRLIGKPRRSKHTLSSHMRHAIINLEQQIGSIFFPTRKNKYEFKRCISCCVINAVSSMHVQIQYKYSVQEYLHLDTGVYLQRCISIKYTQRVTSHNF